MKETAQIWSLIARPSHFMYNAHMMGKSDINMKNKKRKLWDLIGEGSYNFVYKNLENTESPAVLKTPKSHDPLSEPSRAARKWNLINPDLPAKALTGPQIYLDASESPDIKNIPANHIYLYCQNDKLKAIKKNTHGNVKKKNLNDLPIAKELIALIKEDQSYLTLEQDHIVRQALKSPYRGLIVPFVEGTFEDISEEELANAVIDVYIKTRQIVIDYDSDGNFVRDIKTGKIRCIDVDETLSCDSPRPENTPFDCDDRYTKYYDEYYTYDDLLGANAILALLYLEKHLKESIFPLETLNPYLTSEVVFALHDFAIASVPITVKTLEMLLLITSRYPMLKLSPEHIHDLEIKNPAIDIEKICNKLDQIRLTLLEEKTCEFSSEPDYSVGIYQV